MAQATAQIGVTGLGVMGRNLARNFARHGYTVALHNRTTSRTTAMVDQFGHEGNFVPAQTAEEFVQPRSSARDALVIMVNAGPATDAVIDEFAPLLEDGDMIIDGGNAHFGDTRRREAKLREQNLHFVGMGVSGGEEGALNGPSIMPGGSQESYQALGPMLETISAHVDGTPCCTHIGPDGAGHFVKMVHNGIEYADMQLIAEAYDLLRHGVGMTPGADRRDVQDLEHRPPGLLSHRDHRRGPGSHRRQHRQALRRHRARPGRTEGDRPLDRPGRARPGRAGERHRRGGLRPLAVRPRRPAPRGPRPARPHDHGPPRPPSSPTRSSRPCTRPSWSPTPRAGT